MVKFINDVGIEYNSFIYIWIDELMCKYYIGSHIGNISDGYLFSGLDITKEYKNRPSDFRREILSYHIVSDQSEIRRIEKQYLVQFDVENNPSFYNRTNESYGGFHRKSFENRLKDIDENGLNSFQRAAKKMAKTRKIKDSYRTAKVKEIQSKKEIMYDISQKISQTLKNSKWVCKGDNKKLIKSHEVNQYLNDGWVLGMREYSFTELKSIAMINNINSAKQWFLFSKENNLPRKLNIIFKDEWVSWFSFLEKNTTKHISYNDCVLFAAKNNIKSAKQWIKFSSMHNMPTHPERKFKSEWKGWDTFLNKKNHS